MVEHFHQQGQTEAKGNQGCRPLGLNGASQVGQRHGAVQQGPRSHAEHCHAAHHPGQVAQAGADAHSREQDGPPGWVFRRGLFAFFLLDSDKLQPLPERKAVLVGDALHVIDAESGYANGTCEADADYKTVCKGETGFRETVRVEYDPEQVSLDALLMAYFYVIDPTVQNRQGNDRGSQYQTGVYFTNESARETVKRIAEIERGRSEKFFVEIGPLKNYYPAEEYHQNYLEKNPNGYCHIPRAEMELFSRLHIDPGDYQKPAAESIRDKLTAEQYRVTQESGTERAFTGEFWDKFEKGIYVDIVTGEPLFSSTDKFESGCGWPAFTKPIESPAVVEREDLSHGMRRTEVRSRAGDSHLGHVFTGDPESPNGVRYCINSASLRFVPYARMEAEGYGYLLNLFEG
mgnify:CR=1 FL=1